MPAAVRILRTTGDAAAIAAIGEGAPGEPPLPVAGADAPGPILLLLPDRPVGFVVPAVDATAGSATRRVAGLGDPPVVLTAEVLSRPGTRAIFALPSGEIVADHTQEQQLAGCPDASQYAARVMGATCEVDAEAWDSGETTRVTTRVLLIPRPPIAPWKMFTKVTPQPYSDTT